MASTITRTTWTNDSGTPSSPTGDGTILNNARLQDIYAAIDQMFAGSGSYATFTFGGLIAVQGAGTNSFSASSSSSNVILVRNTNSGTAAQAALQIGNDTSASALTLQALSSTFTGNNNLTQIASSIAGGLRILCSHASAPFTIYTNSTLRLTISSAGVFTFGTGASLSAVPFADGSAAAPSMTFSSESDTGFYRVGSNEIGVAANGQQAAFWQRSGAFSWFSVPSAANGTGAVTGNLITVGRNSSGSGAAGCVQFTMRGGSSRYVWVDNAGDMRIGSAGMPTEDNTTIVDTTGGTVVGAQTSQRATKRDIVRFDAREEALALLRRTPLYRFRYREQDPDTDHVGIMADESPEFTRYAGTTFDPVNAFGYTVAAIQALLARVDTLEAALSGGTR